jgi:glycosyltransferase involved in cell wall biosynthesis
MNGHVARASNTGRVAILLATFNGAAYLSEQLDSFLAQDHRDWVLFWHDDGSNDATATMMDAFAARVGPERCVHVPMGEGRLGVLGSFMALLRAAAPGLGEYDTAAFADQDDVWLPHKLSRGMEALSAGPVARPALYFTRQVLVDAGLRRIGLSAPLSVTPGFPASLTQNLATGCTILLNRAAAILVAGSRPPEGTLHDWWSYVLVSAAGGRIVGDPEPTILHRQHRGNAVGAASSRFRRAVAAARRGPGPFMRDFAAHVRSLGEHASLLSPAAARDLAVLRRAIGGGPAQRLEGLRLPGLRRNHWTEGLLFRLWFLIG